MVMQACFQTPTFAPIPSNVNDLCCQVALILGVDAFLDMARTSINLVGNCLAAAVMARWEGDFHRPALASQPISTD
jgi:Na+/H+-dicarboxylate symporter